MSMDHDSPSLQPNAPSAFSKRSPTSSNGKASVAPPKATVDEHVELKDMLPTTPTLSIEEDIMQLARMGELSAIQKLIDGGKFGVDFTDEEGITPLHVIPLTLLSIIHLLDVNFGSDEISGLQSIINIRSANI